MRKPSQLWEIPYNYRVKLVVKICPGLQTDTVGVYSPYPQFLNWHHIGRFAPCLRALHARLDFNIMHVSRVWSSMFSILHDKKIFKIFEKSNYFSNHHATIEIENNKFGTKYLKTHAHRVISTWYYPNPNLISNFETHRNVCDSLWI